MDDQKLELFNSIATFVSDLNTGFGKKYKPVALYNRLIEKTTLKHEEAIERHINAFRTFFDRNPDFVKTKQITNNSLISYSDRVYLDIGKILHRSDHDSHEFIYQHLVTIYSLIYLGTEKSKEALNILQNCQQSESLPSDMLSELNLPDSKEGDFLKHTISQMSQQIDMNNPMGSMMNMMSSGFLNNFMSDMQNQMENGNIEVSNLLGTVTGMLTKSMPKEDSGSSIDPGLQNMLNSAINNLSSSSAQSDMPDNLQKEITKLVDIMGNNPSNTSVDNNVSAVDNNVSAVDNNVSAVDNNVSAVDNNVSAVDNESQNTTEELEPTLSNEVPKSNTWIDDRDSSDESD